MTDHCLWTKNGRFSVVIGQIACQSNSMILLTWFLTKTVIGWQSCRFWLLSLTCWIFFHIFTFLYISPIMLSRCLLWLMCEAHQVCGFLWEVPPAAHALPLFATVFLALELKPTERHRVRGGEQRPCTQAPAGTAGIGQTSNRDRYLPQDFHLMLNFMVL